MMTDESISRRGWLSDPELAPPPPARLPPARRLALVALLVASTGAVLLALTWDLRPYPIPGAVDDYRYVVSADNIKDLPWKAWRRITGQGPLDWLGSYDPTTLFKRPGISFLMAGTTLLHLPFLQTMLVLYLAGLAVLANSLLRLDYSRLVVAALVGVCGLIPTLYDSNAVRVLREIATGGLELAIVGLCLMLFSHPARSLVELGRSGSFLLLMAALGFHWSLREEAVLLWPAVFFLVGLAVQTRVRAAPGRKLVLTSAALFLLTLPAGAAYLGFAALNRASYGLFLVNDLSEGSFPKAVSALAGVEESPCDHTLLAPSEVGQVMAVSPAFRTVGDTLATALSFSPEMVYTDAFSVVRVGALLDSEVGMSPQDTQDLFRRIALEVEAACEDGRLRCASRVSGGIVPWLCSEHWREVPANFAGYLGFIVRMRHSGFSPLWSGIPGNQRLHPYALETFEATTRQKMAGRRGDEIEFSAPAPVDVLGRQDARRARFGRAYESAMPFLMTLAAAGALVALVRFRGPRRLAAGLLLALAGHVLVRAGAFAYLSTVDGYLNTRYISVCYPVAAAFAVLGASEILPSVGGRRLGDRLLGWIPPALPVALALAVAAGFVFAGAREGTEPASDPSGHRLDGVLTFDAGGLPSSVSVRGEPLRLAGAAGGALYYEAGWLEGQTAVFDGWAIDPEAGRPAGAVLVFVDGVLAAEVSPSFELDLSEVGLGREVTAGFEARIPLDLVRGARVRLFARGGEGQVFELNYPGYFPYW